MSEPKPGKKNTTRIPEAEVISNKTSDTTSVASSAPLLPGKQQTKAARNQPVKQSPKLADAKPFKAPSGSTVTSITRSKKGKK